MSNIIYNAPPTVGAFMRDNSFMRGLMGPFGSGKSVGSLFEMLRRCMEQQPSHDKIRRSRWAIIRNCYDADTEILTEHRGWVKFPDLSTYERVAALHGDQVKWEVPTYHYAAPFSGEMVGVRSQNVDLLVTPEHHLWCAPRETRKKVWGKFRHYRADEIEGSSLHRMRATADFGSGAVGGDEAFYEFLGLWFAEGYAGVYPRKAGAGEHYRLVVTHKPTAYVEKVLCAAGFTFGRCMKGDSGCANYTISLKSSRSVKPLIEELVQYGCARTKWLPRYIIEAPRQLAAAFLRGYRCGDGGGGAKDPSRSELYYSASKWLLDGVHEMLVRQGRAAVLTERPNSGENGMWELTALSAARASPQMRKQHWCREDYSGMVYCVEVSTHVVLVRRNGKAVWCGQTYPELRDTTRKTFEEWMPGGLDQDNWLEQEFTFTLTLPLKDGTKVEAEFLFRALDRPEHVKKLLSLELTGAWINEAREVPYSVVKMLIGRLKRYPSMRDGGPSWSGLIMDTNPPDDDSWWYKLFEEEKPGNARLFKQPGGRTPLAENLGHWEMPNGACVGHYPQDKCPGARWVKHLADNYYQDLATVNASDPLWIKVHIDAQYGPTMAGRPVYPEYRDEIHTVDASLVPPIQKVDLLIGADFGLTPAIVIGQRDPRDSQIQWIDEVVATDLGAMRFFEDAARYIKRTYPNRAIHGTGDPAGEQRSQVDERTPFDAADAMGIPLVPAHTNDWTVRRDTVGRALTRLTILGRPALVVSSKCKVLRKAMNGGYCLRRVAAAGDERFRDAPDKNSFSHVAEAGQYMMLGEGEDVTALESAGKLKQKFKYKTAGARRQRRA